MHYINPRLTLTLPFSRLYLFFCVTLFVTQSPVGKPFNNGDVPQAVIIHCTIHVTAVAVTSAILTPSPTTTRPLSASHELPKADSRSEDLHVEVGATGGEKQVADSVGIDRCQLGDCWGGSGAEPGRAPHHPALINARSLIILPGGERSLPRRRSIDAEKSAPASIPWRTHAVESGRE